MPNAWITHIKKVQSQNEGMSYKDAMKEAKKTYVKKGSGVSKPKAKKGRTKMIKVKGEGKKQPTVGHSKQGKPTKHELTRPERKRSGPKLRKTRVSKVRHSNVQEEKLTGDGLFDKVLKKRTKKVDKFIKANGSKVITSMTVYRQPISRTFFKLINFFTKKGLKKDMAKHKYDDIFHLFLRLNYSDGTGTTTEKNNNVKFYKKQPERKKAQSKEVKVNPITLKDLMEKAEKMNPNLYRYSSDGENCQAYTATLLKAGGVPSSNPIFKDFILQDVSTTFKNKGFRKFAQTITDTLGLVGRITGGEMSEGNC